MSRVQEDAAASMEESSSEDDNSQVSATNGKRGCSFPYTPAEMLNESISGVTVALAMVPEAVAFSLAAGLPPAIGLISSFMICLLTTLFGGRPAMASGATGAIAALIGPLVEGSGKEYLFYAVMLMGVIQIAVSLLGAGNLVRFVPASVEIGFANGLALVIAFSQLNSYKIPGVHGHGGHGPEVIKPFVDGVPWSHGWGAVFQAIITVISFLITVFLPYLTPKVPSALTGIALGTAFEWLIVRLAFKQHTTLVGDLGSAGGSFPLPVWFEEQYHMPALDGQVFGKIWQLSVLMAVIGILESAMTLSLIDERTKTKGNVMRECVAQGFANVVCGLCGGMGGCAMLGQSMINVSSGARYRLSTFCCSIALLLIMLLAYPAINHLPVAALSGVMFNVVYQTFQWGSLKWIAVATMPKKIRDKLLPNGHNMKIRRVDAFIIVLVTAVTLAADLAIGVGCGVAVACLMHVYEGSTMITTTSRLSQNAESGQEVKIYSVQGVLFFGSVGTFLNLFDVEGDPEEVKIIFDAGYISDFSALEAINKLGERYGELGKHVTLQLVHPGSSRIVEKASNLLVKEVKLDVVDNDFDLTRAPTLPHRGSRGSVDPVFTLL